MEKSILLFKPISLYQGGEKDFLPIIILTFISFIVIAIVLKITFGICKNYKYYEEEYKLNEPIRKQIAENLKTLKKETSDILLFFKTHFEWVSDEFMKGLEQEIASSLKSREKSKYLIPGSFKKRYNFADVKKDCSYHLEKEGKISPKYWFCGDPILLPSFDKNGSREKLYMIDIGENNRPRLIIAESYRDHEADDFDYFNC